MSAPTRGTRVDDPEDAETREFLHPAVETARVMRTGALWLTGALVAAGAFLGPLTGAGWRPTALPPAVAVLFWVGAAVSVVGTALLVWAGCPVLRAGFEQARRRKADSIRLGIPLLVLGFLLAALAVLLSPR